jgi:PhoD related phosphatase
MLGLVETAQKFRLLFQHHTTPLQARKHGLWGEFGHNFICQMGPRLAAYGLDGRTERDWKRIATPKTWDMVFEKLDKLEPTTLHLLCVFPVPFSFIRIRAAEKVFDILRKRAPWVRYLPGLKGTNSIFGLPEFYDDLLDEWTHDQHIEERNDILVRLQKLAEKRRLRVTFLSGDVHCAAFARFRSDKAERESKNLLPENDTKLMYQGRTLQIFPLICSNCFCDCESSADGECLHCISLSQEQVGTRSAHRRNDGGNV